jgi:hypothetical protein
MTKSKLMLPTLSLSVAMLTLSWSGAQAYEAQAFLDRLKTVMTEQGIPVEWGGFTEDGNSITLTDVKAGPAGDAAEIGEIELQDITDIENEGYRVGTVRLPSFDKTEGPTTVIIDGVSIGGLIVPGANDASPTAGMLVYETADMETLNVSMEGAEVFSMNQLHFELELPKTAEDTMTFTGAAESIKADLTRAEDPQAKAVIEALGYNELNGFFEMGGSWTPKTGAMSLSQFDISMKDAGTFGMSFDLGGYTTEFLKAVREMQKNLAANPGADSSQQGLAMLGLMQQLSFVGASISFTDDSLTNRVLDYVAKQNGTTPQQIANQAKAVVPFMLAQLNDPELTASVTKAVTAFLDDPKNLTISAKPAAGVPFSVIMAGAMSAPQALPKQLGVTVTANE